MSGLRGVLRWTIRFFMGGVKLGFKALALGFLLLVLTLTAAFFGIRKMVDEDKARGFLAAELSRLLRRPVEIDSLFLTPKGVKLRGVRVGEAGGEPGRNFIESDYVVITVKLRPLLERRLELDLVKLVGPRIRLSRGEDGRWNVADIFSSTRAAAGARLPVALPQTIASDHTVIEDGSLSVDDRLHRTRFDVSRFNLVVKNFDLARPFPITVSFNNENLFGGRKLSSSWSGSGEMTLASGVWELAEVKASKFKLDLDGVAVKGSGSLSNFSEPVIGVEAEFPAMTTERLRRYVPAPLDFSMPASRWKAALRPVSKTLLEVERLRVDAGPLNFSASGRVDWGGARPELKGEAALGEVSLAWVPSVLGRLAPYQLKGTVSAQASVSGWPGRLAVHKGRARLRSFGGTFRNFWFTGGDLDATASDDFTKFSAVGSRGAVSAFLNTFSDIRLSLRLEKKDLKVDDFSMKWGGSELKLKARVQDVSDPKEVVLSGSLDRLRWESGQQLVSAIVERISASTEPAAPPPAAEKGEKKTPWVTTFKYAIPRKFPDTIGHITVGDVSHEYFDIKNFDALWELRGVSPSLRFVNGDLRVSFGPGRINDVPAVQKAHGFLEIVFLPFVFMHKMNSLSVLSAATAYPRTLDFKQIEGEYSLRKGVATTRYFHVDSPQLMAYADGAADFGKETVDMNILTRLTEYRGGLPEWWVDELGRPAIGFRVKGNLSSPDLEPRLNKMKSDEIERARAEGISRARKEFRAEERIKELSGERPKGETK